MTVKELKDEINGIDEEYDDVQVVYPSGQFMEGYTPAGGVYVKGKYVHDNFPQTEEDKKRKRVCVVWIT